MGIENINSQSNIMGMKQGAITLLDVLGWKGIWKRKPNAWNTLKKHIDNSIGANNKIQSEQNIDVYMQEFRELKTKIISISDTIAIASYSDNYESVLRYHNLLCSGLICDSIIDGIPFRGATCYGYFRVEDNILVGPAIDEVAEWYEASNWIGVIYTPSAKKIDLNSDLGKRCVDYQVPMKKKGKTLTKCVNWPSSWKNTKGMNESDLRYFFKKMGPVTPEIEAKHTNSLDFYKYSTNADTPIY